VHRTPLFHWPAGDDRAWEWTGYAPTAAEEQELDGELDRRVAQAAAR
jgi:hypothetical protein